MTTKYPSPDAFKTAVRTRVDELISKALTQGHGKVEIPSDDAWIIPDVKKDLEAQGYSVYFQDYKQGDRTRTLRISLGK